MKKTQTVIGMAAWAVILTSAASFVLAGIFKILPIEVAQKWSGPPDWHGQWWRWIFCSGFEFLPPTPTKHTVDLFIIGGFIVAGFAVFSLNELWEKFCED